jgi:hypothetical protein
MSNQNVSSHLAHAHQHFSKLIGSLSDEQFLSPMNGWAPRDVVAHLIGWNRLMIEASLSLRSGKPPAYYDDAGHDYSNINASFTAKYSSQSKPELLAELQLSLEELVKFVDSLPIEELSSTHGVMHHGGDPATIAEIIESLTSDYEDHAREIEEWLNMPKA